jgi:hypothetical protein
MKYLYETLQQIILGGDQMTASRVRGCQLIRINSTTESKK